MGFAMDAERLKAMGLAALTSVALFASPMPAYAKGGGHGGGGHGGGGSHSSHSTSSRPSYPKASSLSYRSSSRRSSGSSRRSSRYRTGSSSPYYDDRNLRIFPTDAMAREAGGLVCPAPLPKVGSKVDVVGVGTATVLESRPALQSDLYPASHGLFPRQQPLMSGFDEGCTLAVQYSDGSTDTISAAQKPKSEFEETVDTLMPLVTLAGYFILLSDGAPHSAKFSAFEEMETILSDVLEANSPMADCATKEKLAALSGEYWGGSEGESDGGDQSIRVTLHLQPNGRITGRGHDGEDGSYTIPRGRWVREDDGRLWVAWEEKYYEGFRVVCIGHIDAVTGKVKANFASSRRVTGAFSLAKKPSVF